MKIGQFHSSFAIALVCVLLGASNARAQFDISWFSIDGGGGYSAGGSFEVEGTIGQHDAGQTMTGGSFSLTGGFWAGGTASDSNTVVPLTLTVFRGLQTGGTLEDVFTSDDARIRFNPGLTLSSSEAPVWLIFDAALPNDLPAGLQIVLESQAGTPGLTSTIEAWNWQTNAYDEVDVTAASFNNDTVVTVDLSGDILDYVQAATAAVRTRIGWRKTGLTINFPWEIRVDQMVWLFSQ